MAWLGGLMLLCGNAAGRAGTISAPSAAAKDSYEAAARGLESAQYAEREAATSRLAAGDASAVPVLLAAAKTGNLEAAVRAVGILESIYIAADERLSRAENEFAETSFPDAWLLVDQAQDDAKTANAAEFAIDELSRVGRPSVADRALVILESHNDIRERLAVAAIERLKGKVRFKKPGEGGRTNAMLPAFDRGRDSPTGRGELEFVIVGPKWIGGDEGLKHVARLKRLHALYRIQGAPVSDDAVARLKAAIPGLDVQERGAAKLGIQHQITLVGEGRGCLIGTVEPGESADNAGLRKDDVILRFAGYPVESFNALIDLLRNYRPGNQVDVLVLRDDVRLTVRLTLTGWD